MLGFCWHPPSTLIRLLSVSLWAKSSKHTPAHRRTQSHTDLVKAVDFLQGKPVNLSLSSVRDGWGQRGGRRRKRPEKSCLYIDEQDTTAPVDPPSCWRRHRKQGKAASEPWLYSPWALSTSTIRQQNNGHITNPKTMTQLESERRDAAGAENKYDILLSEKTKSLLKYWQNRLPIERREQEKPYSCDANWERIEPEN